MNRQDTAFFDTCTLQNFAVVSRLDLLEKLFTGRAAWTDGTALEVRRAVRHSPSMAALLHCRWLGTPVAVGDAPPAAQQVDRLRRAIGGAASRPTEHLGEAQTIHRLLEQQADGVFVTDDRQAADFAVRNGLTTMDTVDILRDAFDAGLVGCPEAYELLVAMASAGRGIALPPSHLHVCAGP